MQRPDTPQKRPTTRRGSAYVLVLALSIIVTVLAATAIESSRIGIRASTAQRDASDAALIAQGGLDHLLQREPLANYETKSALVEIVANDLDCPGQC